MSNLKVKHFHGTNGVGFHLETDVNKWLAENKEIKRNITNIFYGNPEQGVFSVLIFYENPEDKNQKNYLDGSLSANDH